jgi:DNA-binding transcriptional MocR family regulator
MERLRRRLSERMGETSRLMTESGWELFCRPSGGMFLWARWPGIDDAQTLVDSAARQAVSLASGAVFTPEMAASPWIRINVTYADDARALNFLRSPV